MAVLFQGAVARASCGGQDLLAALPSPERQALQAEADRHPHSRGLLFRAERGTERLYLLGTMHLPDPRHDAILAEAAPLLAGVKLLLVEADHAQQDRLKAEISRRPEFLFLTEGPKLNKLLSETEWAELARRMQEHGVPPLVTSRFRPWYLAVMLGLPPCLAPELKDGHQGLDHRVMAKAEARGLPVASLEPFDTIFSLFGELSMAQELEMIRATLLATAHPEDVMATTVNGYFARETRLVWEFSLAQALASPGASEAEVRAQFALMEEVLVNRRNRAWIPVLTEALQQGPVFAAFGALHLPGKNGVLALLEAEGFTVTRLD